MSIKSCEDIRDEKQVVESIKSTIAAKQYGYEELLSSMIAKACIQILPKDSKDFNVDHVRVVKILGEKKKSYFPS